MGMEIEEGLAHPVSLSAKETNAKCIPISLSFLHFQYNIHIFRLPLKRQHVFNTEVCYQGFEYKNEKAIPRKAVLPLYSLRVPVFF